MGKLANLEITVNDESSTTAVGLGNKVPLFVIATQQDKVLNASTNSIAEGTTKANAGKVEIITSRKNCTDFYGNSLFEKNDGTINQNSELNEVGLQGLYDALGSTSIAYAIRADINTAQLLPSTVEPTGSVENNTKWLDLANSSFGLFRNNGNTNKFLAWDRIDNILFPTSAQVDVNKKPLNTFGYNGDVALVQDDEEQKFYENVSAIWYEIGTQDWQTAVGNTAIVVHSSQSNIPENKPQGSIWVKTSAPNFGVNYVLKNFNTTNNIWQEFNVNMYDSFINAEKIFGDNLSANSFIVKFDTDTLATSKVMKFGSASGLNILGSVENPNVPANAEFTIHTLINNVEKTVTVTAGATGLLADLVTQTNAALATAGITVIRCQATDNKFNLIVDNKNTVDLADVGAGTLLTAIGVSSGSHTQWNVFTLNASPVEPVGEAAVGTLWFDDTLTKVDILRNTGATWTTATVLISTVEPEQSQENDVWLNPSDKDYPTLYNRFGGNWILVDNTDNSSSNGIVFAEARNTPTSTLLASCPQAVSYPQGILLWNLRYSANDVKEFDGENWVNVSGKDTNGVGFFGTKAQRKMILTAMQAAVNANDDIRSFDYDFMFALCPGYPEMDNEFALLNTDRAETVYIVSDTPKTLKPTGSAIFNWGTNVNNAIQNSEEGRVQRSAYFTRQYPPMGFTSNIDGEDIAIPSSVVKLRNLLATPDGQISAGVSYGQILNASSVGFINDEGEYEPVQVKTGLAQICAEQNINPIMRQRNTGLLFWGENTENNGDTALSAEHNVLTLINIKKDLDTVSLPYFFKKNTASLRMNFNESLTGVLLSYVSKGDINDFVVVTDSSVNTNAVINSKGLIGQIGIEFVPGVEWILIPINIRNLGEISG